MSRATALTVPDLVVLSLLAESPRHGYDLNMELERRDVADWAGISRPQVYYSLKKLHAAGLIAPAKAARGSAPGPERQVFELLPEARRAMVARLARDDWATQRPPPPFLTWLALAWLADPGDARRVVARRRDFLAAQIARERQTLADIRAELGPGPSPPHLMIDLTIRQFELERDWLAGVDRLFEAKRS